MVGFDPCGRVVDVLRAPVTVPCRFFADRPDIVLDQVWYPALPDAPDLGIPSAFMTLNYEYQQLPDPSTVGAVRRPYGSDYNGERPNPLALGGRFCGTPEEFAHGQVFDPDANFRRRPDGLLACCQPSYVTAGGAMMGGAWDVSKVSPPPFVYDPGAPMCGLAPAGLADSANPYTLCIDATAAGQHWYRAQWNGDGSWTAFRVSWISAGSDPGAVHVWQGLACPPGFVTDYGYISPSNPEIIANSPFVGSVLRFLVDVPTDAAGLFALLVEVIP